LLTNMWKYIFTKTWDLSVDNLGRCEAVSADNSMARPSAMD
jgi:hypothetical protein